MKFKLLWIVLNLDIGMRDIDIFVWFCIFVFKGYIVVLNISFIENVGEREDCVIMKD